MGGHRCHGCILCAVRLGMMGGCMHRGAVYGGVGAADGVGGAAGTPCSRWGGDGGVDFHDVG